MIGVRLKVFHCGPSSLANLFNEWVQANPAIEIAEVKVVVDPNPDKHLASDVILLVFYYPD